MELSVWCVVCGPRGTSDAILNVALFVPLGFALGAAGRGPRTAIVAGAALSLGIELAQTVIPHRYPGLGDVLYNATGAAVGAILFAVRGRVFDPSAARARRYTIAWGILGAVGLALQGWFLGPEIPARPHSVEWTPESTEYPAYPGRLVGVRIDGRAIERPSFSGGRLVPPDDPALRAIEEGTEIELAIVPDTIPRAVTPLLVLRDEDEGGSLFVGVDHRDLIVRYRTRAGVARLDAPYPRWRNGAAWTPDEPLRLRLRGIGRGLEAETEAGDPTTPAGPVSLTVSTGRGWGFLMFSTPLARLEGHAQDLLWMFLLALPLGWWGPVRPAIGAAGAWTIVLLAAPLAFPLLAPSAAGAAGAALGIPFGALARYVRRNPELFKFWRPLDLSKDDWLREEDFRGPKRGRSEDEHS